MINIRAAIISLGSKSSQWTYTAMQKYFDEVDSLDLRKIEVNLEKDRFEVLYASKPLREYDCIYAKGSFRYEAILRALTSAMHKKCYMPLTPQAFTAGHNKLLTHLECMESNIPMPRTYLASSTEAAKNMLDSLPYPLVIKFPHGTQGKGVMFADSHSTAVSILDALSVLKQPILLQEYIETEGTDIRAIVVGDKVAASMYRKAEKGDVRANIHAGGKGIPCMLDSKAKKIALDTAQAIGAEICAVDILESPRGPLMIEINLSPGLQGITDATNIDVADKIARHLFNRTMEIEHAGEKMDSDRMLEEFSLEKTHLIQNMIVNAEMRGERLLLPKLITKLSDINLNDEISISAKKGSVEIKKM